MKNYFLFLFAMFIANLTLGQSVTISKPNTIDPVDIGIPVTYTATVSSLGSFQVVSYTWHTEHNEAGESGPSGIMGKTDGGNDDMVTKTSAETTSSIVVIYSDVDVACESANVSVIVELIKPGTSTTKTLETVFVGRARCIVNPGIRGKTVVQECCTEGLVYKEANGSSDFSHNWTITGATIVGSNTNSSVGVQPNNTTAFNLKVVIGIVNGNPAYTRTRTLTVDRSQISTPIDGPDYLCDFNTYLYCIDDFCGLSDATWQVPAGFEILPSIADIDGNGPVTRCVHVRAGPSVSSGFVGQISVQAEVKGGCHIEPQTFEITRYTSETPPVPDGYPVLVFEDGYDPCETDDYYVVVWRGEVYENGVMTIGPGVIIDVPHHDNGQVVEVEVCNVNLCSGMKSCSTYQLELPFPCEHGGGGEGYDNPQYRKSNKTIVSFDNQVNVYPVPTTDMINIEGDLNVGGNCMLMNLSGKIMMNTQIENENNHTFSITEGVSPGLYYLYVPVQDGSILIKKVVITD